MVKINSIDNPTMKTHQQPGGWTQWPLSILGQILLLASPTPAWAAAWEVLSAAEVAEQMQILSDWNTDGQRLYCTYEFDNFIESINFVNHLVVPAEATAHHPDIEIFYNRVTVSVTTHDAGGITDLDFELAQKITEVTETLLPQASECQP